MVGSGYAAEMAGAIMTTSKPGEECVLGDAAFFEDGCICSDEAPGLLYRGRVGRGSPARGVSDSISWGRRYWLLELAPFRIIRCTLFLFSLGSGFIKTPTPLRRDLHIPLSSTTNSCISASLSAGSACPFATSSPAISTYAESSLAT